MQASMAADLEVERRLEDFARARLTPVAASKARSRARVMREARLAFADQAARAAVAAKIEVARYSARSSARRTTVRRGAALLAAAVLSLVAVGGVLAASTPGGPLYGPRVWLETVMLPTDASGRADAELARLEMRLAEVRAAVRSGDRGAAAAALAAYEQIADEALAGAGADAAAIDRVRAALDRHVAVLERVAGQVPPQAADAINATIEKAISHNDATIQRIEAGSNGGGSGGGADGGAPGAQPAGGSGPSIEPVATPRPKPTPKPTPKPHSSAAPAAATAEPTPKVPPGKPSQRPNKTPQGQPGH